MSNISGAWAAVPSVGSMRMTNGIAKAGGRMGARRAWRWRSVEEEMGAGSAGISNISGAWAAIPFVGPMCVPNGVVKARGRMGAKGAGSSVEQAMSR
jgi:hypothetical protein